MELRIIDGQPFVHTKAAKRDVFQTPLQVIADAQQRITQAGQVIEALRQSEQMVQRRLDTATLAGESTESIQAEIAAIDREIRDAERDVTEAHGAINQVYELVDTHAAQVIQQADGARLQAALQPFATFLQENSHE